MIKCIFAFFKNNNMNRTLTLLSVVLIALLNSCASREKLQYFQGIEQAAYADSITYNPILKQDDLLSIIVSAASVEATANFNLTSYGVGASGSGTVGSSKEQPAALSYLVDNKGYIDFPVLGQLKVAGLTRNDAMIMIKTQLKNYIKDPFVTMRILNFKIIVQGEVATPGVFPIATERVTLPEALAMAGDLTIFGKRDNILIIRENEGKKTYNFIDITNADFINSPFYYLSQNDLIYVEPNKVRMNASASGPNIGLVFASISLLLTIATLIIK